MRTVFADTSYYPAIVNDRDELHRAADQFSAAYDGLFLTTAWVLTELANSLARAENRSLFVTLYADLQSDDRVAILPADQSLFERGLRLYERRPDKDWSLTDCISFVVMEDDGIREALTGDHHFEQAGFNVLLKP